MSDCDLFSHQCDSWWSHFHKSYRLSTQSLLIVSLSLMQIHHLVFLAFHVRQLRENEVRHVESYNTKFPQEQKLITLTSRHGMSMAFSHVDLTFRMCIDCSNCWINNTFIFSGFGVRYVIYNKVTISFSSSILIVTTSSLCILLHRSLVPGTWSN